MAKVKKTATKLRRVDGWRGEVWLYQLLPTLNGHEYVLASAVDAMFTGPETYIFPATADGEAVDMMELDGSFKGSLDCDEAIRRAGYEVRAERGNK